MLATFVLFLLIWIRNMSSFISHPIWPLKCKICFGNTKKTSILTIFVHFRYFDITSLMKSQIRHTWSVCTLFGTVGQRRVPTIPWNHFYECGVLSNKFPEGVIVTPLVRYVVKNTLVGRGLILSSFLLTGDRSHILFSHCWCYLLASGRYSYCWDPEQVQNNYYLKIDYIYIHSYVCKKFVNDGLLKIEVISNHLKIDCHLPCSLKS